MCSGKEDVKGWFGNNWLRFVTKLRRNTTDKRPSLVSGVVVIAVLGIHAVVWREILKKETEVGNGRFDAGLEQE